MIEVIGLRWNSTANEIVSIHPTNKNSLEQQQLDKLRRMLETILPGNDFYRQKFSACGTSDIDSLQNFKQLPFTTKAELVEDQLLHPPFGTALTFSPAQYIRIHQTSGSTGNPLYWLDTEESWDWWAECWKTIFQAAGVGSDDRIFFAFSFGPFIGFWAGWEGARKLGAMAISGGSQSTMQRVKSILDQQATVLVCTPTYALHMAAEAEKAGINLARDSSIRITIHAGEPGANIPATKKRIADAWGARCFDHPGATEIGAFGFECEAQPGGVHINESEFIAEFLDPNSGEAIAEGEQGELVITNLGRIGSPVIRYRTGDLVQPSAQPCPCGRSFVLLDGGVLGRVDDMIVIRGVNVFPSAIENVMREFPQVEEFRIETFEEESLRQLKVILDPNSDEAAEELGDKVGQRLRECIGLRAQVELVPPGTLPRFELKAKRFFKL
jgi:phenylacetate-CoA ligase